MISTSAHALVIVLSGGYPGLFTYSFINLTTTSLLAGRAHPMGGAASLQGREERADTWDSDKVLNLAKEFCPRPGFEVQAMEAHNILVAEQSETGIARVGLDGRVLLQCTDEDYRRFGLCKIGWPSFTTVVGAVREYHKSVDAIMVERQAEMKRQLAWEQAEEKRKLKAAQFSGRVKPRERKRTEYVAGKGVVEFDIVYSDEEPEPEVLPPLVYGSAPKMTDPMRVFGFNLSGQLGIGEGKPFFQTLENDKVLGVVHRLPFFAGRRVLQVSCGNSHCLVATNEKMLFSFGDNSVGQLGIGVAANQHSPQPVARLCGLVAVKVSCGGHHNLVTTVEADIFQFVLQDLAEKTLDVQEELDEAVEEKTQAMAVLLEQDLDAETLQRLMEVPTYLPTHSTTRI